MCSLKQKINAPDNLDASNRQKIKSLNQSYYILIASGSADVQSEKNEIFKYLNIKGHDKTFIDIN